jgi:5-methylcytosine-specific restriction endonuclease McrA
MKKHTKVYIDYFEYCEQDFIPCEMCGTKAVDVHHIEPRGMGGSKTKDYIENLVGLCRKCHLKAEKEKKFNEKVKVAHLKNINKHEQNTN